MSDVRISTLRGDEDFAALGDAWDALVRSTPDPVAYALQGWLLPWRRHHGPGSDLHVVIARREGRIVAGLPIEVRGGRAGRVATVLDGAQGFYSELQLAAGEPQSTADAVVDAARELPFDALALRCYRPDGPLGLALSRHRVYDTHRDNMHYKLDIEGGWQASFERVTDGKRRSEERRRVRRLEDVGPVEIEFARTPDEIAAMFPLTVELHRARWQGLHDGSGYTTPAGEAFNREALVGLAEEGITRIALVRVGGRPAAFASGLVLEGVMTGYRSGYDPALTRQGPSMVALLRLFESVADEGVRLIDFGPGHERWKRELSTRRDDLHVGVALPRSLRGAAQVARRLGVASARRNLRRVGPIHRAYLRATGRRPDVT